MNNVATAQTAIKAWWDKLPAEKRRASYRITDFKAFGKGSNVLGPALKSLGWSFIRDWQNDGLRVWLPPGGTLARTEAPTPTVVNEEMLKRQLAELQKQLKNLLQESITDKYVKEKIFKLKETPLVIPSWLIKPSKSLTAPGVPTLFASDWHWGEVVFPKQINGVNEFNLAIAHARAHALIERTIDLLFKHVVNPDYPGIVFALGGDMVSGGIHEELMATDEMEIAAIVVNIVGVLVWCIKRLKEKFKRVFIPCVTGNHGRLTHKIRAKGRNFTSADWLIYQMLAMHFQDDPDVTFHIPDGSDAHYRIYNHRYLLTHGDQFRGGDGLIGMLGPVIRGDHKKRSRNGQIDMSYDTMILGHWHQLVQLRRVIVNGSLKGYDEYAYTNNFGYEPPAQGLWLTHPEFGITISMPVFVDPKQQKRADAEWVSWKK